MPTPAGDEIARIARKIARANLATPAILFAESLKPLGFVAGQLLRAGTPLLGLFVGERSLDAIAEALEKPDGIERFVRELERQL